MNRNVSTNSLPTTTKLTDAEMLASLDDCDPEQLERLKARSPWFNGQVSDAEIEELKQGLMQRATRPVALRSVDAESAMLCAPRLFEQFGALATRVIDGQAPPPLLLHNFDATSAHYARLFRWGVFGDVVQPLLKPVHFQCYTIRKPLRPLQTRGDDLECARSALVHSHFSTATGLPLLTAVELALGAVVSQVLLKDTLLLAVMEWREAQSFYVVVAFAIRWPQQSPTNAATLDHVRSQVVSLSRQDLTDETLGEETTGASSTTAGDKVDMAWLREIVRGAPLSYLYSAYARRD